MAFVDTYDPGVSAIAESLERHAQTLPLDAVLTQEIWAGLAAQGLFSIDDLFPDDRNAAICAAMETRVSLGQPPYMPAASEGDIFFTSVDGLAVLLEPTRIEPVETLSTDGWVRVEGAPSVSLGPFRPAQDVYDLALGAWLVGAGLGLLDSAVAHARTRRQFGQSIGSFQAVGGPLSRAAIRLDAARALVLTAGAAADGGDARLAALVRHSSARAASEAALVAHQTFGALGMVEQGPVQARSKRIRQLMSQYPPARRIDTNAALSPGKSLSLMATASAPSEVLDV